MKIIESIKIRNFRSILNTTRGNITEIPVSDVNILVGENDAGKSNFLKALNLFFNNKTDINTKFEYKKDLSFQRIGQRKLNKDIEIELVISPPEKQNYKFINEGSIRWVKTWYADNQSMDMVFKYIDNPEKKFRTNNQNTYYKWLKNIRFRYVPAIKSNEYFSVLLAALYDVIPDDKIEDDRIHDFGEKTFIERIQKKTKFITRQLKEKLGIESVIQFPGDFRTLFSTLEFGDSNGNVMLKQRGDGIKVRHIPIILKFMAEQEAKTSSKKKREPIRNTIWGFEEPENNLEFNSANSLVESFLDYARGDKSNPDDEGIQIFLTTHSPIFYTIGERAPDIVNTYYVKKEQDKSSTFQLIPINPKGKLSLEKMMELKPLLELSETWRRLREEEEKIRNELETNEEIVKTLKEELENIKKPVIITEGDSDKAILECAWKKLYENEAMPFKILSSSTSNIGGGNGGADALIHFAHSVKPDDNVTVVLFDNDKKGVNCFGKLDKNFTNYKEGKDYLKRHKNKNAYALLLPPPSDLKEFGDKKNLPIEFYFDRSDILKKTPEGKGIKLVPMNQTISVEEHQVKSEKVDISRYPWACRVRGEKMAFAREVVPTLGKQSFRRFRELFELIRRDILGM